MSYGDDYGDAGDRRLPSQTRTRLPEEREAGPRRPAASPRRSLMTIVGVVVLLIAAIVFANQAGDTEGSGSDPVDEPGGGTQAQPTAPTGELPVDTSTNGIPSGFPQTEQGAQSAAANYAVALGGDGMFNQDSRHAIVDSVYAPAVADDRVSEIDRMYSDAEFLQRIGLEENGAAPEGSTFVSRIIPVGTSLIEYADDSATVAVWYSSLFGLTGEGSTNPVTEGWYTNTYELTWSSGDWKVTDFDQVDGPTPVAQDQRASTAEEMAQASEQFGGFTYAR